MEPDRITELESENAELTQYLDIANSAVVCALLQQDEFPAAVGISPCLIDYVAWCWAVAEAGWEEVEDG